LLGCVFGMCWVFVCWYAGVLVVCGGEFWFFSWFVGCFFVGFLVLSFLVAVVFRVTVVLVDVLVAGLNVNCVRFYDFGGFGVFWI